MRIAHTISIAALGAFSLVACGGSDGGGSADSFCEKLESIDDSGVDPDTDPEAAAGVIRDLANSAPSEVKDDFETFADAMEVLVSGDIEAMGEIDPESIDTSVEAIGAYIEKNCDAVGSGVFDL